MKRNFTDAQIIDMAKELLGSCKVLDDVMPQGLTQDHMEMSDCLELDSLVMQCESCAWWCESDSIDGDGNCDDCLFVKSLNPY